MLVQYKCFLSSPYRSHVLYDTHGSSPPFRDAMCSMLATGLDIVLAVSEVRLHPRSCIYSPLIEGEIIRAEGGFMDEHEALRWCLYHLENGGFTHLICAADNTIPRAPGYGKNGCDIEAARARDLGLVVMSETEFTGCHA